MTERVKGFIVVLDKDIRIDDAENTINAIRMIKGVTSVEPSVVEPNDLFNRSRIRFEFLNKFMELMEGKE